MKKQSLRDFLTEGAGIMEDGLRIVSEGAVPPGQLPWWQVGLVQSTEHSLTAGSTGPAPSGCREFLEGVNEPRLCVLSSEAARSGLGFWVPACALEAHISVWLLLAGLLCSNSSLSLVINRGPLHIVLDAQVQLPGLLLGTRSR